MMCIFKRRYSEVAENVVVMSLLFLVNYRIKTRCIIDVYDTVCIAMGARIWAWKLLLIGKHLNCYDFL